MPTSSDQFCGFCFAPLPGPAYHYNGRRYCDQMHADADRRATVCRDLLDDFTQIPESHGEQMSLDIE